MSPIKAAQLRRRFGPLARWLVGLAGFDLTRRRAPEGADASPVRVPEPLTIPVGQTEPFPAAEYEVVPRGGFDIVKRDYYSPIPDLSRLSEDVWMRRSALGGLDLATDLAIEFVERELGPMIAELDVPVQDPGVPGEFFLSNQGFETVDAELLYAMVRALRPRRVIELGSGYTTLLINLASRRNAADGIDTSHEAFDPFPRPHILGDELPAPSTLTPISATEVPLEVFSSLESGDILFVDTTHTVKLASDVNFIILDVLPVLAPGVVVHFHDIFLPWEYPRQWFAEMHWYWAEQYLLQAFLAFNQSFEILVPAHALAREHPDRLASVIRSFTPTAGPASMWLRRNGSSGLRLSGHRP
jgi:Methyltransferase domain